LDLVMEQVESDGRLRERLTARAVACGGGSLDLRTWKQRIEAVFGDCRYFVPYAPGAHRGVILLRLNDQ
jgi:hypothetical protein